jgi:hypothetical protein
MWNNRNSKNCRSFDSLNLEPIRSMNPSNAKIVLSDDLVDSRKDRPLKTELPFEPFHIDSILYINYLPALLFPLD